MTRKEIDNQIEELHRIRTQDPTRALPASESLIAASLDIGYSEHLPQLRLYRADLLFRAARISEAVDEFERCIHIAQESGNTRILGRAIGAKGSMKIYQFDLPAAKELLERAISIAIIVGDKVGEGTALANLADVYKHWGLLDLAVGYAKDAYEAMKDTASITLPLYRLGVLNVAAGDYESAKKFITEGLEFIESHNIQTSRSPFHAELGSLYSRLGDFKKAKKEFLQSRKTAEAIGDDDNVINARILLAANDINMKDYDSAEIKLKETMALPSGPRKRTRIWCGYYLATIAKHRGNPKETIRILDETFSDADPALKNALTEGVYILYLEANRDIADWENVAVWEKILREFREETNSAQFKSKLTTAQALIATERERHDKELEKMKREQLERELSNTTLQLLAQTEALAEFREGILAVVRKAPPTEPIARELREKLKVLPCKSIDWDKFEAQFKAAHPEFRIKLLELYPDLTKMELRICTLIRMNLKSDDISRLTCLSERNIENHRYRIRKKMNLIKEQDLSQELAKM